MGYALHADRRRDIACVARVCHLHEERTDARARAHTSGDSSRGRVSRLAGGPAARGPRWCMNCCASMSAARDRLNRAHQWRLAIGVAPVCARASTLRAAAQLSGRYLFGRRVAIGILILNKSNRRPSGIRSSRCASDLCSVMHRHWALGTRYSALAIANWRFRKFTVDERAVSRSRQPLSAPSSPQFWRRKRSAAVASRRTKGRMVSAGWRFNKLAIVES